MFKDLSEDTTNWACSECGGICSSGIDHICPSNNVILPPLNKYIDVYHDALYYGAKTKKKWKPYPCHNCRHIIKRRKEDRQACPSCFSTHWKRPSLRQRIEAAVYHYKLGR